MQTAGEAPESLDPFRFSERRNQPSTGPKLAKEGRRDSLRRSGEEDGIEGGCLGPTDRTVPLPERDVNLEPEQARPCLVCQWGDNFQLHDAERRADAVFAGDGGGSDKRVRAGRR